MTEYLLLFRNASAESGYLNSSAEMAEDMPKWQSWIGAIASQGKLIHTAPIRFEGTQVYAGGSSDSGPHRQPDSVLVSGFLICKAESPEEVRDWAAGCPILRYPLSSVEIRPLIPFPTA